MITAEGIEGAAYVGDYQPVNLYAGAHKVAGWHSQTVSGEGTVSLDGAYNVPPDALVIDGKCVQTGTPSPDNPAPITTITGDLTITGANGDLSDTATASLGAVELCSLPDGTKDTYDAETGVVTKRVGKDVFDGSADEWWVEQPTEIDGEKRYCRPLPLSIDVVDTTLNYGAAICDRFLNLSTGGTWINLTGFTISKPDDIRLYVYTDGSSLIDFKAFLAANPVTFYYKLAEPYTIQLTTDLPVVRTGIKTLTVSANITPTFTTTVKAMDD